MDHITHFPLSLFIQVRAKGRQILRNEAMKACLLIGDAESAESFKRGAL